MKIVRISTPARLHLGFLDLNGEAGRKYGSIGVAISAFRTTLEICSSEQTSISGTEATPSAQAKLLLLIEHFYSHLGKNVPADKRGVSVNFIEAIPEHAGFGSGTQLAITLGKALSELHGFDYSPQEIAANLDRGKRSGIGIASFENGQFIIDGGLGKHSSVPPVLFQGPLPTDWRIVLIMASDQGVHGQQETIAFGALPVFPLENAQTICQLTLMQLLPALIEQDIDQFGMAITQIQALIGDHFSPAQGGRYSSPLIATLLEKIQELGYTGVAQSSWGPTTCVFVSCETKARQLIIQLEDLAVSLFGSAHSLTFRVTQAEQNGAIIKTQNI